jgi:gliding motility-associated-like protein
LNNSTLANPIANPISTTTYVVTTSSDTCSGVDTVIVFVNKLPAISAGADVSVCIGNAATLTASGGTTYSWNTTATTASIFVSPTSLSTYTVIGTDVNGCSKSDSAYVFVNALPVVSAGVDVSICFGSSTTLTANGGQTYSWNTTATTTSISVAPTSSSSYTVTGTNANGCKNVDSARVFVNLLPVVSAGNDVSICAGNSATLTGSGATTYSWSTGATTTSITPAATVTGTYTVMGTDANGCRNLDSVSVIVNALPSVSAGPDVSICTGGSATLTASGGNIYFWSTTATTTSISVSPTSSSTYTVIGTDANTCSNTDTVKVNVLAQSSVTSSNDTAICMGDSAFLNVSGGASYTWSPSSSLNNSTISNPIAAPTITTTYTVIATNADGCTKSDSVKVSVNQLPTIDAGTNILLCPGNSVSLNATGGISYVWSPVTELSNPNISNPVASPSAITTYSVTGTDANGCRNTDSVLVSFAITPAANFSYSLSLACEGMEAQFRDSSQNAFAWSWNFGDGTLSSLQNPVHTFPYNSNYIITLAAANLPCLDTAKKIISLSALADYLSLQTANVFTPNNDGVNDCFHIGMNPVTGLGAKFEGCANLTVYDRWGVPVYHSEYSGSCWDGYTSAGTIVPEGTYFYIFELNPKGAGGIHLKGFITVLR